MNRYNWKDLNRQQVGTFTEYFVKMEFTMFGFQVYTTEVDDRGIDFVARIDCGPFLEIQVKSLRSGKYVFLPKDKFPLEDNAYCALGLLAQGEAPNLYLIPSLAWNDCNEKESKTFVDREYEGLQSKPEWGINVSERNMGELAEYSFTKTIKIGSSPESVGAIGAYRGVFPPVGSQLQLPNSRTALPYDFTPATPPQLG